MSPDYQQSVWGVALSGIALLAVIAVPVVVIEWRSIREWWDDITRPLP